MKGSISLLVTLFLAIGAMAEELSDPGPDLPLAGRSIFDHVVQENGGVVPSDFKQLVETMRKHVGPLSASFLPRGRSLARFATNSANPRAVVSAKAVPYDPPPIQSADQLLHRVEPWQIYVGHAKEAESVEVISYNPALGRMEFQIIRNFNDGQKPVVEYANRALCMSCHQNGGPLWKVVPWFETDNMDPIAAEIQKSQKPNSDLHAFRPQGFTNSEGRSLGQADKIDVNVRQANRALVMQDIWRHACGEPPAERVECRRLLIEHYFENPYRNRYQAITHPKKSERLEQLLKANWPKSGIKVDYGELETFHPELNPPEKPLPPELDPLTPRPPHHVTLYGESHKDSSLSATDYDWRGVSNKMGSLIPAEDRKYLLSLAGNDLNLLSQALQSKESTEALSSPTFNKAEFYRALLKSLGVPVPPDRWVERERLMQKPALASADEPVVRVMTEARGVHEQASRFRKYCAACHVGQPEPRMNFMDVADDHELIRRLQSNPEVKRRLDWKGTPEAQRMPPLKSKLGKALQAADPSEQKALFESAAGFCEIGFKKIGGGNR